MKAFRIKVRGDNKSKSLEAMIRSHLVPRGCRAESQVCTGNCTTPQMCLA